MHSSLERLLTTARRLPEPLKAIFDATFLNNEPTEVVRSRLGLSQEEFAVQQSRLLREMRCIARPQPAEPIQS